MKSGFAASLLGLILVGCGGGSGTPVDHDPTPHPVVNFDFAYSEQVSTFSKFLTVEFGSCRIMLSAYPEPDQLESWQAVCDDATKTEGLELVSAERVEIYEADSDEFGASTEPHCKFAIVTTDDVKHTVRYSLAETYSPESEELIAFFLQLYESHPPE